jgi:hypothetical protein
MADIVQEAEEGLTDWGVEQLVKGFLAPYVADGSLPAEQVAVIEQATIDAVNIALVEGAKKIKVSGPVPPENAA